MRELTVIKIRNIQEKNNDKSNESTSSDQILSTALNDLGFFLLHSILLSKSFLSYFTSIVVLGGFSRNLLITVFSPLRLLTGNRAISGFKVFKELSIKNR